MHAPVLLVLFCTLAAAAVKWDNVTATTENGDIIFWDESPNMPRFAWYYDRVPKIGLSDAVSTKNAYYFSLNLTFAEEFDGLQIEIQVGTKGRLLAYTAPIDKPRANHFVVLQDWLVSRNGWDLLRRLRPYYPRGSPNLVDHRLARPARGHGSARC